MTLSRARRELAATSWSGSSTSSGTSAWRDDAEGLGADEQGEGEEVQGQVEQREREGRRARGAQGEQDRRDPAVAEAEVVDGRADERRQQGERRHVDDEVEQHLLRVTPRG